LRSGSRAIWIVQAILREIANFDSVKASLVFVARIIGTIVSVVAVNSGVEAGAVETCVICACVKVVTLCCGKVGDDTSAK